MRVLAITAMVAGTLAGLGSASAAAAGCQSWTGGQPLSRGTAYDWLNGVAVLSPCNAWAVGFGSFGGASFTLCC